MYYTWPKTTYLRKIELKMNQIFLFYGVLLNYSKEMHLEQSFGGYLIDKTAISKWYDLKRFFDWVFSYFDD